jgi:adducin
VSCSKDGLKKITQTSQIIGDVSYHDYEGILIEEEEKSRIIRDMGDKNKIMILKNHG